MPDDYASPYRRIFVLTLLSMYRYGMHYAKVYELLPTAFLPLQSAGHVVTARFCRALPMIIIAPLNGGSSA